VLQAKRQAKERKKARQASLKDNYSTLSSRRSSGVPGQGPDEPQPESPPPSKGDATLARERVLGRSIAAELSSVLAGSSSSSKSGSGSKSGSKSGSGSKSAPRLPPSLPPRRGSTPHSEASSSDTEQPQRKPQAGDHARKPRREAQLEDDSTEPPQAAPEQGQLEAAEQMTPLLPPVSRFSLSHLAVTLRGPLARAGAASDAETAATASDDASTVSGLSKARVKSFQGLDLEPGQPRGDLRVTLNIEPTSRPLYAQQLKDASLARIADEAAAAAVAKASRRDA
jgi:hypothetical protein